MIEEEIAEIINNRFVLIDFYALEDMGVMADDHVGTSINVSSSAVYLGFF